MTLDENNEPIPKKTRNRGPSKKVSCRAHFIKKSYTNGFVEVTYHWKHQNHDPIQDILLKTERARKTLIKEQELALLKQEVTAEFKKFEDLVQTKMEECKTSPQKLKELKEVLMKGFEDLNRYMNPPPPPPSMPPTDPLNPPFHTYIPPPN